MQQIDEKAQHVEVHHTIEKAGECFSRISPNIPRVFLEVTQHIHGRFDRALENVYRVANTMDKDDKLKYIGEAKDCVFFQYTSFEYLVKPRAITVRQANEVLSVLKDANDQLGKWRTSVLKDISKG